MPKLQPVLLVEDNPYEIELTLTAFAESKLANRVEVVHDGVEALEWLNRLGVFSGRTSGNPAVVILDNKMPRMDGLEVLQAIRADPALCMIPVVMLTSSRQEQDLLRGYSLGTNAYVVKPVKYADFVAAIQNLGVFWAILNEAPPADRHANPI